MSSAELVEPITILRGPCQLPPGSAPVTDADEEVFLLYTALASKSTHQNGNEFRGLGYIDNHKDVLTLEFDVPSTKQSKGAQRRYKSRKAQTDAQETREVLLAQDKTALRSRKGDTGSVLWKASADFAQYILKQSPNSPSLLLDRTRLADAHILELGAGTGLLAIILSALVREYTATDIEDLVPLILKNLALNGVLSSNNSVNEARPRKVNAEPLDWVALKNSSPSLRHASFSYSVIDLLLVVDCIYHPSLLPALVETIDYLATPERTAVLVLVELRQEDVIREFLEQWLTVGGGAWEIWHVEEIMAGPYAIWVGWKKAMNQ